MHVHHLVRVGRIGSMEFVVVIDHHVRVPTITSFAIFDAGGCPGSAVVNAVCECVAVATGMDDVYMTV